MRRDDREALMEIAEVPLIRAFLITLTEALPRVEKLQMPALLAWNASSFSIKDLLPRADTQEPCFLFSTEIRTPSRPTRCVGVSFSADNTTVMILPQNIGVLMGALVMVQKEALAPSAPFVLYEDRRAPLPIRTFFPLERVYCRESMEIVPPQDIPLTGLPISPLGENYLVGAAYSEALRKAHADGFKYVAGVLAAS